MCVYIGRAGFCLPRDKGAWKVKEMWIYESREIGIIIVKLDLIKQLRGKLLKKKMGAEEI